MGILLKAGVNPDLGDRDGVTPLQHARHRGFAETESLLRAAG